MSCGSCGYMSASDCRPVFGWGQVILREQEAIRGHRLPIVHAYSHNDLTALQKYPTGFPVLGQSDSPGSSGENSHSR